jgi:Cu-Zn family superoxide dismutase
MKVVAKVEGLNRPGSLSGLSHGIHIHTFGDLSDGGGTSVGGHFNPLPSREHRLPGGDLAGHVGDLGNIAFYDNNGVAWYEQRELHKQDLNSTAMVLGRAVVIHSKMDDGCTQPTGGAGGKLAWCVIGMIKGDTYSIPVPPFEVPQQKGSSGCMLNNTPDAIPKSASFIWMVVIISVALAAIGLLFGYNWWKARQNPAATTTANGRQPWYQQQNEDEDDGPTS